MAKETFETVEFVTDSGFTDLVYKDIKESSVLTEEHIGKRVMVAGYKVPTKFWLKSVHKAGEPSHKYDSYTLTTPNGVTRCFLSKKCRLHPCEYKKGKRWQR
jgi:hypothetical protein